MTQADRMYSTRNQRVLRQGGAVMTLKRPMLPPRADEHCQIIQFSAAARVSPKGRKSMVRAAGTSRMSRIELEQEPERPARDELFAKAGVLSIMADPGGIFNPEPNEQTFVRLFAAEVEDYLRAQGDAA